MTELLGAVLGWVIPAVVVFGVTAIALASILWAVRRARRSPHARAAAEQDRRRAGVALVRLDDAVEELDLEVALSGALYDGQAPASLRRARLAAQHVRDDAFERFRDLTPDTLPAEVRRSAARIETRAADALAGIARARGEHAEWMRAHVSAAQQITAARARREALHTELGDPRALVADLARFDPVERAAAESSARTAVEALASADRHLDAASALAADPTRSALAELAAAERELRRVRSSARSLEESHRLVTDAARAVPNELETAHDALRQAMVVREGLETADAERLGAALREIEASLSNLRADAALRPTATVDALARLRVRIDLALGDARTAQQRLRGARSALPGTLSAARAAIAHAEPLVMASDADSRVRFATAQRELASARQADDPVAALDAARRALRAAEDAEALANYARTQAPSGD